MSRAMQRRAGGGTREGGCSWLLPLCITDGPPDMDGTRPPSTPVLCPRQRSLYRTDKSRGRGLSASLVAPRELALSPGMPGDRGACVTIRMPRALGGQPWHEAAPVVNSPCAWQTQPHHSPAGQQDFVRPASGGSLSAQPLSAPHRASAGSTQPRTKGAPCHPPPLCETHQRNQKIKKFLKVSDYACIGWLFWLVLSFLGIFWGFCLLALFSYCIRLNVL